MPDDGSAAFEKLYHEHVDAVLAYALARTSSDLATEAVEATFLVAWRRFAELPGTPRPWLLGVARRILAHQRRSDGRRDALGVRIVAMRAADHHGQDPADEVAERDSALAALGQLGQPDRELLRLVAWEGLSCDEAAQVLGCTKATLKVRLHRARRRFAAALGNEGGLPEPAESQASVVCPFQPDRPLLAKENF